jgi:hypothetical protein
MITGRTQFRRALFGRVILQVEYIWHGIDAGERPSLEAVKMDRFAWRDATSLDLSHPALRWIIDGSPVAHRSAE